MHTMTHMVILGIIFIDKNFVKNLMILNLLLIPLHMMKPIALSVGQSNSPLYRESNERVERI